MPAAVSPLVCAHPDRPGWWRIDHDEVVGWANGRANAWAPASVEVEVYPLEPVQGTLCVWGDDLGFSFDGPSDVWDTDEWLGHLPASLLPGHFINPRFTYLRPLE